MSGPTLDLDAIEARANAATRGPWTWNVNLKSRQLALEGRGFGSEIVLGFARWGMNGARALLRRAVAHPGQRTWYRLDNADSFSVPIPGREHHEDWARDLDHPDAQFIAHARTDVPALVTALRHEQSERARTYAIAKMRERERDSLRGWLSYIAAAGCAGARGGHQCPPILHPEDDGCDPEADVPCYPCIARHALDNAGSAALAAVEAR